MIRQTYGIVALVLGLGQIQCLAATTIEISDMKGKLVSDAVVYLESPDGHVNLKPGKAEIAQKNKQFLPLVSAVSVGTSISFPNNDTVRHHAYSFSTAKPFEIKLYSGVPATPIVFDKTGTVIVGCNIHDQMVAYIHVVNTAYFAKTNLDGVAQLGEVAAGKYKLKVWHYQQSGGANAAVYEQDWHSDSNAVTKIRLPYNVE